MLLLVVSGFILTLMVGHLSAAAKASVEQSAESGITTQAIEQLAEPSAQQAIARGIVAYQSGQFANAIAHWQSAIAAIHRSAAADTALTEAYLLSNLSTAYQQLAQIQNAQNAIEQSLAIIQNWPQKDQTYWEVSARVLNTQGKNQWQQGKTQQALMTWQQAEQHYRNAHERSGQIIAQINQSQALQELGFSARAVTQLVQLSDQLSELDPAIQLATTKELIRAFRRVGDLRSALSVLSRPTLLARLSSPTADPKQVQQIQLERGHTNRAKSHSEIAIGQRKSASAYAEQALAAYTAAAQPVSGSSADATLIQIQAQLNQLSYLVETGRVEAAQAFLPMVASLDNLTVGRTSVEANISYAHSLMCLQAPASAACTQQEWREYTHKEPLLNEPINEQLWEPIVSHLTVAIQQAEMLQDPLLASYAYGELGHTYELTGQLSEAIRLSEQALALLEGKTVPDVAYRWEWQLGRIYTSQGRSDQAITAYQRALTSLAEVRQNLLLVDPQVQFSFRDNVEPIYREFVSLLLAESIRSGNSQPPDQAALKLAVQTVDALQLTELENFLGCNLSQLVSLDEPGIDPGAVKIYPIILPDQLAIIFDIPNQPLTFRSVPVTEAEVEITLRDLRESLTSPGKTPDVLTSASRVYEWLMRPLEPLLLQNPQIETLVFVPDGSLRNIPMGVLYDGAQYLIEKDYAIATAPQLNLFAPRTSPQQLRVLRGGIGLPQIINGQSFPPIELIQAELDQIPDSLTVAPPLLDEDFTQANIERQLSTKRYSAIHWKTHGVFSSTPAETFLVAYRGGITANELSQWVQSASERQAEPLELLVLSACETAQGDRRAVLGLAGIAVRAGTRSTLSTLWRADDGANTELMAVFYRGIKDGLSKAKALQVAQQALLSKAGYPAPYYWASYVLVGNWL
ncbi:MAG: hypothetical protein HLUCCA11_05650 [Phormidesmis priestleyi Ana]|uniref:CHAT domain-containing protein n=1 Tax=Phormidesmis priestleyi Ana TaxID=1666911 RepID=A0A0P8A151_9CYAN|nr:MAG: hypothetical protein HLUCCA11_05650 [Phormidesmis priestleyi Ana]